jgi:hypothetical protein
MKTVIPTLLSLFLGFTQTQAQCDSATIFANETDNAVCTEIVNNVRYIYANSIPDHGAGTLNGGFTVTGQDDTWTMCAYPTQGMSITQLYGDDSQMGCSTTGSYRFGVGTNGVHYAPSSTEHFEILDSESGEGTGEYNYNWNIEAVVAFGVNNQGAHLNSKGEYHYHAIADVYFNNSLGIDGSAFSPIVAYAADGYPVYYKYAYTDKDDNTSGISSFDSGWKLKTDNGGVRSGDGFSAPDGSYNGLYIEDYEFDANSTELDECNGRYGITPDYPDGTYYYVLTDSWPYIPRCFAGDHVDEAFLIGPSNVCPSSTASSNCSASLNTAQFNTINTVQILPSLVSSSITINIQNELNNSTYKTEIYNCLGGLIHEEIEMTTYDMSHLPDRIYYVKISSEETYIIKKIILKKR